MIHQFRGFSRPGFSLYELLITIGIASTLLAIGVPSFASLAARNRLHVEINALFHAIHVARKESIMRRQVVAITKHNACPAGTGLAAGLCLVIATAMSLRGSIRTNRSCRCTAFRAPSG